MLLRITKPIKGNKLTAELYDQGKLVFVDRIDPRLATAVAKLVKEALRLGYMLASEQVLAIRDGGELELTPSVAAVCEPNLQPPMRIIRRNRYRPAAAGSIFDNFLDALKNGDDGDVLEWEDITQLAVLDIDYHDMPLDSRPQPFQLEAMALIVRPQPNFFWISQGRGLHLVYESGEGLTAEEAAACAGMTVKQLDPRCTFEIIAHTSYPPGGGFFQ